MFTDSSRSASTSSNFFNGSPVNGSRRPFASTRLVSSRPRVNSSLVISSRVCTKRMLFLIVTLNSGGRATNTRPSSTSFRIWRKKKVSSSVRMCWPSTSASVRMTIRPYRSPLTSSVLLMSTPTAEMRAAISALFSSFSISAFSTFSTFPRSGSTA